jgi:hypothetical protein
VSLRAFLDDSGKSNDPNEWVLGIGGATGSQEQWSALESRWQTVCVEEGLVTPDGRPYFHAADPSPLPSCLN